MTRPFGQIASRRYRTIIADWFSRYVHTLTPVAKPADPARGVAATCSARTTHVSARAAYNRQRTATAVRNESNRKARSKSTTITGAVTIDSFTPIPSAHVITATVCHAIVDRRSCERRLAYIVSRKHSAISDSVRWVM